MPSTCDLRRHPGWLSDAMRAALRGIVAGGRCTSRRALGTKLYDALERRHLVYRASRASGFVELTELGELVALGLEAHERALRLALEPCRRPMHADRTRPEVYYAA